MENYNKMMKEYLGGTHHINIDAPTSTSVGFTRSMFLVELINPLHILYFSCQSNLPDRFKLVSAAYMASLILALTSVHCPLLVIGKHDTDFIRPRHTCLKGIALGCHRVFQDS